jgi:two-component system sensor histidine kinase MprB
MTLSRRLSLTSAAIVAIVLTLTSVLVYVAVRAQLTGQVDESLRSRLAGSSQKVVVAKQRSGGATGSGFPLPMSVQLTLTGPSLTGNAAYVQLVNQNGTTHLLPNEKTPLPVSARTLGVAAGTEAPFMSTVNVDGHTLRVATDPLPNGFAIQIARSVDEQQSVLHGLALVLAGLTIAGAALAGAFGPVAARAVLRPVRRLTEAAEHVTATRDLSRRIDASERDEIGRLARSFNTMLGALESSVAAQRQLVADASHELRTPLASARTNVEVLARAPDLPPAERAHVLERVGAQLEELGAIVTDVVELARGAEPNGAPEEVQLDELVEQAVERIRLHVPGLDVLARLEPCAVQAAPARLARAVDNLLDNAAKWSEPDGVVEVDLAGGVLRIRDHGPGIPEEELPLVFERFYRSAAARATPGSGLGLAIARQAVEAAGGTLEAGNAEGGGAVFTLRLRCI